MNCPNTSKGLHEVVIRASIKNKIDVDEGNGLVDARVFYCKTCDTLLGIHEIKAVDNGGDNNINQIQSDLKTEIKKLSTAVDNIMKFKEHSGLDKMDE